MLCVRDGHGLGPSMAWVGLGRIFQHVWWVGLGWMRSTVALYLKLNTVKPILFITLNFHMQVLNYFFTLKFCFFASWTVHWYYRYRHSLPIIFEETQLWNKGHVKIWVLQYYSVCISRRCVIGGLGWVHKLMGWFGLGEEKWTHVHLCYASAVLAMGLCPSVSVRLSVRLSQVGVLLQRLNVGSNK